MLSRDGDDATLGRKLERVVEQVRQNLVQFVTVDGGERQVGGESTVDRGGLSQDRRLEIVYSLSDCLCHIHALKLQIGLT